MSEATRKAIADIDECIARYRASATQTRKRQKQPVQTGRTWRIDKGEDAPEKAQTVYTCRACRDNGIIKVPRENGKYGLDGWRYDLEPCQCQRPRLTEQKARRIKSASNLTPEMEGMTFASYDRAWDEESFDAAWNFALALAGGGKPEKPFLFLSGTYGSGKTHLLAAIAHQAMQQDRQPMFVVVPRLMDWLRAGYDKDNREEQLAFQQRLDGICNADVLLLDDLGAEQETKWTNDKLFQIINDRYARRLPTVFSSNLMPNSLPDRIADRVWDLAVCKQVYTVDKSYRRSAARAKGGA